MYQDEIVEGDEVVEVEDETTTEAETETVEEEIDWKARAMKAEALIVKNKKAPVAEKPTQATPIDPIEAALRVNGMSKELIEQLKKVSAVTGKDLVDAQSDPIFIALKETMEKDKKREEASLPVSRGASSVKPKVDFKTANLTREQHMALAKTRS